MTDHVTCHSPHVTLKDRNAKAELNRRSQVCEILAGTGISRREKWTEVLAHGHQGNAPA
jgi:hypothetical protein